MCRNSSGLRPRMVRAIGQIVLRESACDALVDLGVAAVLPLCEVLKDGSSEARCQAATLLARIPDREPVPALRGAIPLLRQLFSPWREEQTRILRAALERIEAAISTLDLPLP